MTNKNFQKHLCIKIRHGLPELPGKPLRIRFNIPEGLFLGGFQNKDMNSPEELKTRAAVGTAKECVGGGEVIQARGQTCRQGLFCPFCPKFPSLMLRVISKSNWL